MATWEVHRKAQTRYTRTSGQLTVNDLASLVAHLEETHGHDALVQQPTVGSGASVAFVVSDVGHLVARLDTTGGELIREDIDPNPNDERPYLLAESRALFERDAVPAGWRTDRGSDRDDEGREVPR